MTRMYIQPSFVNSCEDHGLWSGGNGQYRGDKSADIATFDRNGRARVEAFSDDAIETRKNARKTSTPLTDRILPQAKRVNLLTEQMRELEVEYKSGNMSITDYTLYRDILSVKRSRAQVLLKKAISVRPHTPENNDESEEFGVEYATQNSIREDTCGVAWVDELSAKNSFKKMLQNTCKASRTLVKWCQRAKAYYQELKEV